MRTRPRSSHVLVVLLSVIGMACVAPADLQPTPSPSPARGGTLRVGMLGDFALDLDANEVLVDPARQTRGYFARCCLARSLLTYPGESTIDGGTSLIPDLAERMPAVSRDGLSWTFQIRRGIRYAPPHQALEVTSADFVFAAERALRLLGEVIPPFAFVAGADEYVSNGAPTISGLETPDAYTLVIRLAKPFGAFDYIADPVWAPIPASVAQGHEEDLGLYWPSTGPYMYETYPASRDADAVVLVRNPSWDASTDPRRGAYADRIEITLAGTEPREVLARVERAELDFVDFPVPGDMAPRYRADANLSLRLRTTPGENVFRLPMNIAVPPFDDLAVRRAVSYAVDRRALSEAITARRALELERPQAPLLLSEHAFTDNMSAGLLVGYNPFGVGSGRPDVVRARAEMSASRYDSDGDGVCDSAVCAAIRMPAFDVAAGERVRDELAAIGLAVRPEEAVFETGIDFATTHTAIELIPFGWFFELTGAELAVLVRGGPGMSGEDGYVVNTSLVGASSEQLAGWGYAVTSVPSVDDVVEHCEHEVGRRRAACWAELDQLITERVVPWVPLFSFENPWLSSARVADFSLDQSLPFAFPALDKVTIVPGQ